MFQEMKEQAESRMKKSIDSLSHDLSKLRTGRAHPSLIEGIMVDYYNCPTPLQQVATINIEDARTLAVTPFEKHMVQPIDKAILKSGLGLNPVTAGQVIRVPLPPLTEESRRSLTKQMKGEVESAKVAVRNIRRDVNQRLKQLLKDKTISEDEQRKTEEVIQKLTDRYIAKIDEIGQAKEADLMQV